MAAVGLTAWAYSLSELMLSDPLPRRWAHSLGVARRARSLSPILGRDTELLEAAAVLHDVGYSPPIATTGFHPLDGARFLRDQEGADERVVRLVAHHSCALLEAEERGLRHELESEFELERPELVDALIVSDMTTTPYGEHTTPTARLNEIVERYGPDTIVGRFIQRAAPEIHAAHERVELRMASAVARSHQPM
ncbi:HD domain-containing protein [Streptomyces sp. JNUCC 64]